MLADKSSAKWCSAYTALQSSRVPRLLLPLTNCPHRRAPSVNRNLCIPVPEDVVRVVQGAVGWARDDMLEFTKYSPDAHRGKGPSAVTPATASAKRPGEGETEDFSSSLPAAAAAAGVMTVSKVWRGACALVRVIFEVALREVATLFRRKNGALPPTPRLAVFMILALVVWTRRHRRNLPPPPREAAATASGTPPRNPTVWSLLSRSDFNEGLASPSRSLHLASQAMTSSPAPQAAPGSPVRSRPGRPDGVDPSLPSPAQVRPAQTRDGYARTSMMRGLTRRGGERNVRDLVEPEGERVGRHGAFRNWGWRWGWRWRRSREPGGGGGRRYWLLRLVLLWLVASVLEVRVMLLLLKMDDALEIAKGGGSQLLVLLVGTIDTTHTLVLAELLHLSKYLFLASEGRARVHLSARL